VVTDRKDLEVRYTPCRSVESRIHSLVHAIGSANNGMHRSERSGRIYNGASLGAAR
jgi:hypothetical protein